MKVWAFVMGVIADQIMVRICMYKGEKKAMETIRKHRKDDSLIFGTYDDAWETLKALRDLLTKYGEVSLRDLYSLTGNTTNYDKSKYIWKNLDGAAITETREGWVLGLPPALVID